MVKEIAIPSSGIVVLVGPSNSGKTTLLERLQEQGILLKSEILSSDSFRIMVGDTDFISWDRLPKDQSEILKARYQLLSENAFKMMTSMIDTRCRLGKLTVVDATHIHPDDRKKYLAIAERHNLPVIAIVLNISEDTLLERDRLREFPRGKNTIKRQAAQFKKNLRPIKNEGFTATYILNEDANDVCFIRRNNPLEIEITSGLDFIGDIHGCYDEFVKLLNDLGYVAQENGLFLHPEGRKFVSLGDVVGRGPASLKCLLLVKKQVEAGLAYMIDSNHGWKIARWLDGRKVNLSHGDEKVAEEFEEYLETNRAEKPEAIKQEIKQFLLDAPSHLVFTENGLGLVVAVHAGIRDGFIGRDSKTVRDFCRYGDTDGFDESGKPIRKDWFLNHTSGELIIWGHDPRPQPMMVNNTINIDQGVVFGGALTAFRYPEKTVVSIKAKHDYSNTDDNPLANWNQNRFGLPNIQRYLYGYHVDTEIYGPVKMNSGEVKAAIDSVSHYTVPIEELVYIPPTMSPAGLTSDLDNYLEHPREAFEYYRAQGINSMVVEKKHMGSRAIVLLFENPEAAVKYIGRSTLGTIYSRTGRPFFDNELGMQILEKLNSDLLKNGYFQRYETNFVLLDTEILPWNLKAKELISSQYAHVAEAAILDREKLIYHLNRALGIGREVADWLHEAEQKLENVKIFREVFENYCWDIQGIKSIQIAPFHTLAHSSETFFDRSHLWHMEKNQELAGISTLFVETEYRVVTDELSEQDATEWWVEMTGNGHEGFVVKPEMYISRNAKGELVQPAIKVRGQKYLHIIYGIDYLLPENLKRIKKRNVGKKQRHALMEFALGVEGVTRFVNKDTVERIHDCVLGTLALEEEPVDPRL